MFACFRVGYFSSQQTEYKWPPSDILKHLGKAGVFPVAVCSGWELCGFEHGLRIWRRELGRGVQLGTVYGVSSVLNAQPQRVFVEFRNPPFIVRSSDTLDHILLEHPQTESVSPVPTPPWHWNLRKSVWIFISCARRAISRQYRRLLLRSISRGTVPSLSIYTLMVPRLPMVTQEQLLDQCLLNVVYSNDTEKNQELIHRTAALMVASLKDYMFSQQLSISEHFQTDFPQMTDGFLENITNQCSKLHTKRKLFQNHKFTTEERRLRTQSEIVHSLSEKDNQTSAVIDTSNPQSVRSSTEVPSNIETQSINDSDTHISKKTNDLEIDKSGDSGTTDNEKSSSSKVSVATTKSPLPEVPLATPPVVIPDLFTRENEVIASPVPLSTASPITSEYELISEDMLKNVGTDGISDKEESLSRSSNESESSSWSNRSRKLYYGSDNGVTILKKITRPGSTVQSYLGKGVINTSPDQVWNTIRNPQSRFMYDESIKKLSILSNMSSSLKTVHCQYEVQQLFRKESWDVCVLQTERVDGDRYILAMQSIHDVQKKTKRITRAQVLPSGWIIQPHEKDGDLCSMVTFISQMDFGGSNTAIDKRPLEDMVSKQPLAILQLRNFLQPTIQLSKRRESISSSSQKS
ncbi:hypothetical protein ScPMuIL_013671 [Solemya velum]